MHLAAAFPELHLPRSVEGVASGVLVEGTSVLVRVDAIHRRLPDGWRAFRALVPNRTLCADMELTRVGFMGDTEAQAFADRLEQLGLKQMWEARSGCSSLSKVQSGQLGWGSFEETRTLHANGADSASTTGYA